MAMVEMLCRCGVVYEAKESDLKRGYGYSHDKSCAAKRRDFGGKKATRVDGTKVKQTVRSPSTKRPNDTRHYYGNDDYVDEGPEGWDGHKDSFK